MQLEATSASQATTIQELKSTSVIQVTTIQKLKSTVKELESQSRTKDKQILSLSKDVNGRESRKWHKKPIEELGERQKRRLKRARDSGCKASLGWLEEDGYTPVSIQVLLWYQMYLK